MKNIGEKIKKIRDKNKLSQKRFGHKLNLSAKTISAYENGKITPPYKVLEQISETYNENLTLIPNIKKVNMEKKLKMLEKTIEDIKKVFMEFDI